VQPTKWESEAKSLGKRLTKREKLALLESYRTQMSRGRNREEILDELAKKIGVSSQRQVERIIAQAGRYEQEIKAHFAELSITALKLASNFQSYLDNFGTGFDSAVGDVVYGGSLYIVGDMLSVKMWDVDRPLALNLLCHLKEEFPELANISDWTQLTSNKMSHDFIARLQLKANRGDFMGKCPACPDC